MKKILKIISLVLVYAQVNLSTAFAGDFFVNSHGNADNQTVKMGYSFKFGTGSDVTYAEKINQDTTGADDFFSEQLGTIALIFLLSLIFTVGSKESASGAGGGGGNEEGGEFVDSKLVPENEEIKESDQVTEAGIPGTNEPGAASGE